MDRNEQFLIIIVTLCMALAGYYFFTHRLSSCVESVMAKNHTDEVLAKEVCGENTKQIAPSPE